MKIELRSAVIENVSTRKDGTIKLIIGLPELPPDQAVQIFSSINKEATPIDIFKGDEVAGKSPSQKMKAVLYVLWEQEYQTTYAEFATFYAAKMENFINLIKAKLE